MKTIIYIVIAVLVIAAIWWYTSKRKNSGTGALGQPPKADGTCNSPLIVKDGICSVGVTSGNEEVASGDPGATVPPTGPVVVL